MTVHLGAARRPQVGLRATTRRASLPLSLLTACLVAVDALALAAAFAVGHWLRFQSGLPLLEPLPQRGDFYVSVVFWALPVWLGLFALNGLYDARQLFAGFQEYARVVNACTAGVVAIIVISFFDISLVISRGWLLLVCGLSMVLVGGARFGLRRVVWQLRRRGHLVSATVIVGANEEGQALAEQLQGDPASGLRLVGFVDTALPPRRRVLGNLEVLGSLHDLGRIVDAGEVRELVVAMSALSREELLELYRAFGHDGRIELRLSSGLFEILTTGVSVREVSSVSLMTPQRVRITGLDAALKALLDYGAAAVGLLVLALPMLLIALLIRLDSGGPVIHRRRVLGRSGRPFDAFKFRTMIPERRQRQVAIDFPDRRRAEKTVRDPRVTRFGRLLRRTSLDELPQLLNVLRGEMSLIGPRMISPQEAALYGKWGLNLLTVKPGITGPWQVQGRCQIAYEERVQLSMQYIRNYSIWRDLEILLRTLPAVVRGTGAY